MEELGLIAADAAGRHESIMMEIDDSIEPSIRVKSPWRFAGAYAGFDLLECLEVLRRELEEDNLLLCCQGARPTVFPSGMTRQMSNGRLAYPLRRFPPLTDADLIDIFAPAQFSEVGTIEEQRQAVREFYQSLGVDLDPGRS
jgi:hypothetical protein